ncbi:MAG: outer membrane beta-barrel protein, partial [Bacteroidaceae bacterium]|nr:outer membrane beta-barrel protein [Bacteroidaceae bacterium]
DTLINRQLRESLGTGHDFEMNARLYGTSKVKGSNDVLNYGLDGSYKENARQQFSRQGTNYAESQQQPLFRHQFADTPPRSKFEIAPFVSYTLSLGEGYRKLFVGYRFYHRNLSEQERIYRLDRLQGADSSFAHPIDLLPSESEYQQVFDRANSTLSHYIENRHSPWAFLQHTLQQGEWGQLCLDVNLSGELRHQRNDYERGSIDTVLYRFAPTFDFSVKPWLRTKDSHHAGLEVGIGNNAPDLLNEAAVVDDTDPMNIRIGNPDLHYSLYMKTTLDGNLYSFNKRMHNRLDLHYGFTHNAIGMGQTYDRQTGIRTYRPTNVNGNWDAFARHTINYSFGDGKKHNARMITQFSYRNSVDLMGENETPDNYQLSIVNYQLSSVRTATLSFEPSMSLSLGKHTLNFSSDIAWNRYTSDRASFQDISAWQYRIGADAIVHLPWEFDLTTNLTLYGRTGYADASLNTSDLVWNARLARSLFKGKWLVMLDGFDILGQLSNVTRTINAQGRTETYTNVLPRYALLHVVYKFSKQPKKRE